jgi:protein TonB
VAEIRREPPPAPRPTTDRPTVAPAPLATAPSLARTTPAPTVSGPAIDPKRDAAPRIGGPQGAVVAGARPTLGGVPRGDGYDRAAAVKYAESVATEIQKRIRYPRMAERAGLQGTVELVLTYDARGKFVEARVRKSSGHKSLDDAALDAAVAAMSRMGRAPERTPELSIPYNFKIEDR